MTDPLSPSAGAAEIAAAVRSRNITAAGVIEAALDRIAALNPRLNAFTTVTSDEARRRARDLDVAIAAGRDPGPLAGVPFAAKSQFDIAGTTTTAGSRLLASDPPAARDAGVVEALHRAGAVCLGAVNMDEFGLGGTTENTHYGTTHNPHDLTRVPGGSSGGSAAAVAAGMVPLALGTDGLGSVRLPASLCGVYGLRPTEGSVSRIGLRPAPGSLAIPGPMARSAEDMALAVDALRAAGTPGRSCLDAIGEGIVGLKIAHARGGTYSEVLEPDPAEAVETAAAALGMTEVVEYPQPDRARAAAMLIMSAEGATSQLDNLRNRLDAFDPRTRDRLLAAALLPASWYIEAMTFRAGHREAVLNLFREVDVLLMPATPCVAPPIGTTTIRVGGADQPIGPALGYFVQPVAPTGCPALTVPIFRPGRLPIGIQLVAGPHREADLLRVAAHLEAAGVAAAPIACSFA